MAYRIVLCADVHLETTFPETHGGGARRKALADAFVRIVDAAIACNADALTVGGDLYEAERAGPQTARFVFEQFARFGKPVFVAPGNHDPYAPAALHARGDRPRNVSVFNEAAWRAYPLADGLTLWGFGHTPAEPGRPFAGAAFDRGGVQIALVHGSDEDRCPPGKRATAPFTKAEALAAGASLVLTGHYHGGYVVEHAKRPLLAYPGSPEPIKFGENTTHGALEILIDHDDITVRAIPTARTRLIDVTIDLSGATNEQAVFATVEPLLSTYGPEDYVRLALAGGVLTGTRIDRALLEERFGAAMGSFAVRDTTVAYDYAALSLEPTVRGHVVRDLLALGSAGEAALRYALAAFEGTAIVP